MNSITRHNALRNLSGEHNSGLILCWKIRQGMSKNIDPARIREYCSHFYKTHLADHFQEEEKFIFPLLGKNHPMIKKALNDHRKLIENFIKEQDNLKAVNYTKKNLEKHIRFEERNFLMRSRKELRTVN
ncbi:MAG TPA: hemerythrin domain-containing protein [Cyclobacteriaceae bacterium]|jgi:iron-sulfur cluster repair protein YtfE (RIC family)